MFVDQFPQQTCLRILKQRSGCSFEPHIFLLGGEPVKVAHNNDNIIPFNKEFTMNSNYMQQSKQEKKKHNSEPPNPNPNKQQSKQQKKKKNKSEPATDKNDDFSQMETKLSAKNPENVMPHDCRDSGSNIELNDISSPLKRKVPSNHNDMNIITKYRDYCQHIDKKNDSSLVKNL